MDRFQYAVVRYVPDVVREEAVNVGIIVRAVDSSAFDFRFQQRTSAIRQLGFAPDKQLVPSFQQQLAASKTSGTPIGLLGHPKESAFFQRALAEFNGNLQLTPPRGLIANSLASALQKLFDTYVKELVSAQPAGIAPSRVRRQLWSAFKRAHLIGPNLLQQQFTLEGSHAKWEFDLGYVNGEVKLIHSIALTASDQGTNLSRALVMKGMIDEVRAEHKNVDSTAVIQGNKDNQSAAGAYEAGAILRDSEIKVVELDSVEILTTALKQELGISDEPAARRRRGHGRHG